MTLDAKAEIESAHRLGPDDFDWVLPLNVLHEVELSPLSREQLGQLVGAAFLAAGIGKSAFLIAFDENSDYNSPNFLWFRERLPRFVYVDRVAVSAKARGRGLARLLYEELFAKARREGHACVVCEVNLDPPNLASDAFHRRLGFEQIGAALLPDRGKQVRYLRKQL